MENIFLAVKFVIFYGMQAIVIAVVCFTLLAELYQLVRDKVRASRTPTHETLHDPANR